jgi:hypothetical protein
VDKDVDEHRRERGYHSEHRPNEYPRERAPTWMPQPQPVRERLEPQEEPCAKKRSTQHSNREDNKEANGKAHVASCRPGNEEAPASKVQPEERPHQRANARASRCPDAANPLHDQRITRSSRQAKRQSAGTSEHRFGKGAVGRQGQWRDPKPIGSSRRKQTGEWVKACVLLRRPSPVNRLGNERCGSPARRAFPRVGAGDVRQTVDSLVAVEVAHEDVGVAVGAKAGRDPDREPRTVR